MPFADLRRQVHIGSYQRLFAIVECGKRRENILCGGDILFATHAEHIAPESPVIVAGGEPGAGEYRAERVLVFGGAFARETLLQAVTAAATYSGRFMRPSILNERTPICTSSGRYSIKDISLRLRSCPVPPSAANGSLHGWAHKPLLPEREPSTALSWH